MTTGAVVFMLLTMGAVIALNVVCLLAWVRTTRAAPPDADTAASGGPERAP